MSRLNPSLALRAGIELTLQFGMACVVGLTPGMAIADDTQPLPDRVDLRPRFEEYGMAPEAQGARNTCSLFAITAVAEFEYHQAGNQADQRFSQEYLVWAADEATGMQGDQAMFYEALAGLNTLGICTANLSPYGDEADAGHRAPDAAIDAARALRDRWRIHWIRLWNVERPLSDSQMEGVRAALAAGHPVACGLRWPGSGRGDRILEVPDANDVYDGHSIVLTGYERDESAPGGGLFQFRNSDGPRWGDGGYGVMSFAYVRAYANDALWLECGPPGSETPLLRVEAEHAPIVEQQRCTASPQEMSDFGAPMWSNGAQLFCRTWRNGAATLGVDVTEARRYRVRLLGTAAPDFGLLRITLDGIEIEENFDLYSGRVCPAGSLELGEHELQAGRHTLKLEVIERNDASSGYAFGIDAIDLLKPAPREQN